MTTIQDDRLRALMVRLEEMTPPAPDFESLRGGVAQHRPGARTIVAIAAALAIIITGLVLIGSRRNDSSPADQRPLTTHSVATVLPDGWEVTGAADGSADESNGLGEAQLFATPEAPMGPVLALLSADEGSYGDERTQVNVTLADGRRAAIGSPYYVDGRLLDVEAAPGQWVGVVARGISDDVLLAIGTMVRVDAAGYSALEGQLPAGLISVGRAAMVGSVITNDYSFADPNEWPVGSAFTRYGPAGGAAEVAIAAFPARAVDSAVLGVVGRTTRVANVGGKADDSTWAVDFGQDVGAGVYRVVDGIGFFVRSSTLDTAQLLTMIDSLDPVTDVQWSGLEALPTPATETIPVDTVAVASTMAPPPTYADSDVEPTRVPIDYVITPADEAYLLAADLPTGKVSITSRFVGRSMILDAAFDGESLASIAVDVARGSGGTMLHPDDGSYLYAYTAAPSDPAAELRITVDGYVYSAPYITIDPTYPVKIAMVLVPPTDGRIAPPSGYIYDAAGKPLDSAG